MSAPALDRTLIPCACCERAVSVIHGGRWFASDTPGAFIATDALVPEELPEVLCSEACLGQHCGLGPDAPTDSEWVPIAGIMAQPL